jgi:HD-GYP domain-containing protein (c-di-GMP phosphodiesterase class II)
LLSGLVGVVGIIIMTINMDRLSEGYMDINSEVSINWRYTMEINSLLFRHQAIIANHVVSSDEDEMELLRTQAEEIGAKIKEELAELGDRVKGGRKEQLYKKVYSNAYSYLKNSENIFTMSSNQSDETAEYYSTHILAEYVDDINESLTELNNLTLEDMEAANIKMEKHIRISRTSEVVCLILIVISISFCLIYCVKLTTELDHNKKTLELDVEKQTAELRRHIKRLNDIQDNTILSVANLIENRDGDTGMHIKRTSAYVELLARAAQRAGYHSDILTDDYIELITKAAPLHDIGKISVPDNILKKPGKLTEDEFVAIKAHAAEGGRIIKEVLSTIEEREYVDVAVGVASAHHEKWDGTGYPRGLKGEEIPLYARIMAIADVFDALISKRCYKAAMTLDEAFAIIKSSAGTHFDPTLAQLFIDERNRVEEIVKDSSPDM